MTEAPTPSRPRHPLEDYLGYQLRRAATSMQADLAARIATLGLTIVEMSILLVIAANPLITQSEIGRMLAIKRANMVPLAKGLQARGLITRQPVDGRSEGLALTEAGLVTVEAARAKVAENEDRMFGRLGAKDRVQAIETLRRIRANLE